MNDRGLRGGADRESLARRGDDPGERAGAAVAGALFT